MVTSRKKNGRAKVNSTATIDIIIAIFFIVYAIRSLTVPATYLPASWGVARYLVYLIPPLSMGIATLRSPTLVIRKDVIAALFLFTLATLISTLFAEALKLEVAEYFLVIGPPLCVLVSYKIDDRSIKRLAVALIVLFVISVFSAARSGGIDFDPTNTSGMVTESTYSFPLAVVTLYFLLTREWKWSAVLIFITVLSFKRSAILGLLLSYGAYFFLSRIRSTMRAETTFVIALLVFVGGAVVSLSIVRIFESFQTQGISINQITAGRFLVDQIMLQIVDQSTLKDVLVGHGWGYTTDAVKMVSGWAQPHNDFLKMIIDQGWIGLISVCAGLVILMKSGVYTVPLCILMSTIFVFDNTLIYLHSFITFLFVASALRLRSESQLISKREHRRSAVRLGWQQTRQPVPI